MSRIGKQPISIPPKVKVEVKGQTVSVEGPKGKLNWSLPQRTSLKVADGKVVVSREGDDAQAKALHGRFYAHSAQLLREICGLAWKEDGAGGERWRLGHDLLQPEPAAELCQSRIGRRPDTGQVERAAAS